jgi:putative Holliday junction resolvase
MTILALDVGNRRIGVAISDPTELLARPLTVISRRDDATALAAIRTIVEANGVTTIVVGVPLATDGTVGEQARRTFEFTRYLRRRLGLPIETWDEHLSTQDAEQEMIAMGVPRARRKQLIDAAAAAVILDDFLAARRPPRPPPSP